MSMPPKRSRTLTANRVDDRLDWRDPNMPCVRDYVVENDFGQIVERGTELVGPKRVSNVAKKDLHNPAKEFPTYHVDPSYNWGKKAKRCKAQRLKAYGLG